MKLGPDMYYLNTFNISKHEGVSESAGGGATKKSPENAIKLRESRLLHYLKSIQKMLKRRGFFHCPPYPSNSSVEITWVMGDFNPYTGRGCFLLESNLTFKFLLAGSIVFLHITSMFKFFGKILKHPKINPGSSPVCYCINLKLIKTNSSFHFYWKIIYLLLIFAIKFSENNNEMYMTLICNLLFMYWYNFHYKLIIFE